MDEKSRGRNAWRWEEKVARTGGRVKRGGQKRGDFTSDET